MINELLAAAALAIQPVPTAGLPIPTEYQGTPTAAVVLFLTPQEVNAACGNADPLWNVYACTYVDKRVIVMPNPCLYPEAKNVESYAHLMCHEKAHINGWRHGNKQAD